MGATAETVSTVLRTPRLLELMALGHAAPPGAPLLISGEPGVGKDTLARLVHEASARRRHAFIKVNCAARPSEHLEGHLFGRDKDASVPERRRCPGSLEFANAGTLYLDEIGAIPGPLVEKLLRAVQARKVSRCGAHETIHVDVRLMASTAANTAETRGDVWEELRRLGAVELRVPPLRDRPEEIVAFASFFMDRHNRGLHPEARLRPDVLRAYQADSWPGNLRQLEEAVLQQVRADGRPVCSVNPRFGDVIYCSGLVDSVFYSLN